MPARSGAWTRAGAALLAGLAAALASAAPARGDPYLPPPGEIFAGVGGGARVETYERQTGKHPPVFQSFKTWGQGEYRKLFRFWDRTRTRGMMHLSTATGVGGREVISPGGIAAGRGDRYLIGVSRDLARRRKVTYVRLLGEMNAAANPYCAFGADGRPRGAGHTTHEFRRAWRRMVIIMRGGEVQEVNRQLRSLGLLPVGAGRARRLPQPRVAFLWVPKPAGDPPVPGNMPIAYWPGPDYVDWVGTDFYSREPDFALLERFYRSFPTKPFVVAEWGVQDRDDPGFVTAFFRWVRGHQRTRMILYYEGFVDRSLRLASYPRSQAALRAELRGRQYVPFAPEFRRARVRR